LSVTARLYSATLPWPLGLVAAHYWFTVADGPRCDRWEIWQRARAGGTCVGHLHCNLKAPEADVGGGPARMEREWAGEEAARILGVLRSAESHYPFCHRYLPWPGPNSNTFAAWVLRRADIGFRLPGNAIGRNFRWRDG
jgi:hypothetical protein